MHTGIVGMGIMGRAMAERLLHQGQPVTVTNRTREKAEPVLQARAGWASTPAELAKQCEVVISLVTDPAAVEQVSMGPTGILAGLSSDSVHCDMSTVSSASSRQLAERYRAEGKRFVQAPVLGSKRQIESGTLLVFGGGSAEDVQRSEPVWRAFSSKIWTFPAPEQAATVKLACNMLIAHTILGLGQSLLFAAKGGVSPSLLLEILGESALGSPMAASKGKTLLERNFQANFVVRNLLKDVRLAAETAQSFDLPQPFNTLSEEMLVTAIQQGWGDEDYSAVVKVLEQLAGLELKA